MRGWLGEELMNISAEWKDRVRRILPDLEEGVSFEFTSDVDYNYNCLSWALSINTVPFENQKGAYWPWEGVPDDTADGWVRVCGYFGFEQTDNTDFVAGYEKIAILQDEEGDLHATRQDKNGVWKSKLGDLGPDIDHNGIAPLESAYGKVVRILRRRRTDWDEPN